jgi:hypothetical protein
MPPPTTRKTNPIKPNFHPRPSKRSADPSARWDPTSHGSRVPNHGSRALILQNKPNLQKCETNRNLCPERTYETATARNSRKNKANLQKCKNEPNHLFTKDLRKITPVNSVSLAYNSAPIREYKRCFRAISRAIRDNSRQLALIRDKTFCGFMRIRCLSAAGGFDACR